jgi:hypothetical protein
MYHRRDYNRTVEQIYDQLVARFEMYPHLNKPDSEDGVKNFGLTRWNDSMFESEEDIELDN